MATVQRDGEGDPALVRQLEQELETVGRDAAQDDDLMLRPFANRVSLLLRFRAHPPFTTQAQLDEFVATARRLAATELDTLGALGSGADLALATTPRGFPLTWAGRVRAALTLGADPAALLSESVQQLTALTARSTELPPRIVDRGLPVPLAALAALAVFELRMTHTGLPEGNAVGDFARATARFAQFRFYANFLFTWERIVGEVADAVAAGTYVPRHHDYLEFVQNRQRVLRELPARARERPAMSEEELLAIQRDSVGLGDAALLTGMAGGLAGLLGVLSGWSQGGELFGNALGTADGLVVGAGDGEKIAMALRWLWDAGYVGGALGETVTALIANGPDMLKSLAVIVVLQMIPFVNLAVDVYLMFQLGTDILAQLTELGLSLSEVTGARSVTQMQKAAGRLARVLTAGGIQILTTLVTMGVVRGVSALRARTARIRAANPALSEEAAMRQAMREATAAERAPLESASRLGPWERGLNRETRPILDTPGVRARLAQLSDRTRRLLTVCASPCLPPAHQLLAADLERLDRVLSRLEAPPDHPALREYFHRRRDTLVQAIDDLDRGVPDAAGLSGFLDRAVVASAVLPAGASVARNAQGLWVVRRASGIEVVEYDIRAYRAHGRDMGTRSFFQSHHGIQGAWARERGIPGYAYGDAPGILLRDSRAGSPHQIVNRLQDAREGGRLRRTYLEEREEMRKDLTAAGVPASHIAAAEAANDAYFGRLYRASNATAEQLRAWFGTWTPP